MSHYYDQLGNPCHFQRKKDRSGNRPTTVYDARALGLLPSPTTILATLSKPALVEWRIKQAIYAFATAPDQPGETLDEKIIRVIDTEGQHEEESAIARDKGTAIHDAIEARLNNLAGDLTLIDFAAPVVSAVLKCGRVISTETVLVNKEAGYAGKADCITENDEALTVCDFKSCKTVPKKDAYPEHKMQVASYAKALGNTGIKRIECSVIYISKENPGEIKVCPVYEWSREYQKFEAILKYWYLANDVALPKLMESELPF